MAQQYKDNDPRVAAAGQLLAERQEQARAHQKLAAEVDRLFSQALETFRGMGFDEGTIVIGSTHALTRFAANRIVRAGGIATVSQINRSLFGIINHAAEQILQGPTREVPDPPANEEEAPTP